MDILGRSGYRRPNLAGGRRKTKLFSTASIIQIARLLTEIVAAVILRGLCELFRFFIFISCRLSSCVGQFRIRVMIGERISRRRMLRKKN
jgi:hypothetical protein